jgi:hypothetical protein
VRRNALRTTMPLPHVVSQWETGQWSREGIDARGARANSEYLKPIAFSPTDRNSGGLRTRPSLNFLGTPESDRWDFGSIRHIKQCSTEMRTPISAVDSVFELPCAEARDSPNSSTHSSFIAELEDTSSVVVYSKRPVPPAAASSLTSPPLQVSPKPLHLRNRSMDFKCDGNTVSLVFRLVFHRADSVLSLVPS